MRLVISSPIVRQEFEQRLGAIAGIEYDWAATPQELVEKARDADILVVSGLEYSAGLAAALGAGPGRLKFIQLLTAGYETLTSHGVPAGTAVASAGAVWSPAVAEHAMGLVLAMFRQLPDVLALQARREWSYGAVAGRVRTLHGCTMCIVGFGGIGHELAARARSFGMSITGVTRSGFPHPLADKVYPDSELKTALAQADVIVLAVPLSPATVHLIGAAELAVCRAGAVLVNVARGGVVDQVALREALMGGVISGAALDVTDPEPLASDDPLWSAPNLVISPHIGAAAGAAYTPRLVEFVVANVETFLRKGLLVSDITARLG